MEEEDVFELEVCIYLAAEWLKRGTEEEQKVSTIRDMV